ncbi:serine/threonine-protein phosphatase 6 regulatory ankyrin repeat subunit B-like [Mercenaria mercenaria]|uniref:serine/threonine-protein phosphatase 6 regulatory ankyrin repeat subunit B-like n=1 Tax=Mercenaria mercenaria TaxID=6596 RepID=UPI00234E8662|nr:serine/threonine-protein phosphatase 6 regulatory ankyrin repeat subunit B-like [Mercenaria mercenaria]
MASVEMNSLHENVETDEDVKSKDFDSVGMEDLKLEYDGKTIENHFTTEESMENVMQKFYESLKEKESVETLTSFVANSSVDVNHAFTEQFIELPYKGWTALHFVCKRDGHALVKCLLDLGADAKIENKKGESPLHIACKHGHYRCVEILLQHDNSLKDKQNNQGLTPLMKAVYRSDTSFKENNYGKAIDALILAGCDVNLSPPSNMSPLHVVAGKWHSTGLVKKLIKSGADVNANTEKSSPLMTALCRQKVNTETVIVLIDSGADVNYKNKYEKSLLHVAVAKSEDRCVEHLLRAGALVNVVDSDGNSPLWIAVSDNNATIAPMLLDYGGDVNFTNRDYNMSLLCKAACDINNNLFTLLLERGANVDVTTKLGAPPLHYAVDNGSTQKVKLLLSKNCALDDYSAYKDLYNPMNALQIAFTCNNDEMIKLLLRAGFPVEEHQVRLKRLPKNVRENEELVEWIYDFFYSPKTLKHLCRLHLRRVYGTDILKIVESLVKQNFIPQRVADAMLLQDLLKERRNTHESPFDSFDDYSDDF